MTNSLYEKFKAMGVDMSWYEKTKGKVTSASDQRPIPLTDDHCSMLSIYLLQKSGKMFTTTSDGQPYEQVRKVKSIAHDIYLCACCKKQFPTYAVASQHYQGGSNAEKADKDTNKSLQET